LMKGDFVNNTYKTNYTVRYSDVDSNYYMRFDHLLSIFQDITGLHSTELGVDGRTLLERSDAFWVLTKVKLKFSSLPKLGDDIELETWPSSARGVRFMREYAANSDGGRAVMGTSEWCTIGFSDRKIRRVSEVCYPHDLIHREEGSGAGEFFKTKESVDECNLNHTHTSSYVDIDSNKHTNNLAYLRMSLNCFSLDELDVLNVSELQINFLNQTFFGDKVSVYKKKTDCGFYIEGRLCDTPIFNCTISLREQGR
ncbi:MAG: hypothetical protein IKU65_00310, partial [Oscillospiraceae bacterium]|nr:hypothetical protein [Oscillospiraceae bacterium]